MAQVLKRRRLANPVRRRRRNMSPKQIRFFGTRRQKAALRNRRRNQGSGIVSQAEHAAERAIRAVEEAAQDAIGTVTRQVNRGRRSNVGEIITVLPAGNPGRRRRKNMARAKNRRRRRLHNRGRTHNVRRRRRNPARVHVRRRRHHNPRVIVRYRNRRSNRRMYNRRRRNQGLGGDFLRGDAGKVIGLLGGAFVTNMITGFLPSTWKTGVMGYLTTGVVAVAAGQFAGRAMNNKPLGNWITLGGLLIVGLQVVNQFFPTLQLPFTTSTGTSGMGLISSSNFYVPQVNMPGSMASFVTPAGIPAPVVLPASTGMRGLGAQPIVGLRSIRRVGRMR